MAAITLEKAGSRLYFIGNTFAVKDQLKAAGAHWDGDRKQWWIGASKSAQAQQLIGSLASAPTQTTPNDDTRVKARVNYKGKSYYIIAESTDRCRLTVLDGSLDFWADKSACELVRTYEPREYRGRTEYTTLGSLRRFVESQKRAERQGLPECAACGKRGHLHHDLEDGLMKCHRCCDIPE